LLSSAYQLHINLLGALILYHQVPDIGQFFGGYDGYFFNLPLELVYSDIFREELNIVLDMFSESTLAFCDVLLYRANTRLPRGNKLFIRQKIKILGK